MNRIRPAGRAAVRTVGLTLVLTTLLAGHYGCSGCMGGGGDGGQTPDAPPGAKLVGEAAQQYEEARVRPRPQAQPSRPAPPNQPATPPPPGELTRSTYGELRNGMSFEEVIKLVGPPNMSISRTGAKNEMYRWTNEAGDSYMARFENGKLVHKTKLNVEEEAAPKGKGKRITMKQYNQIEEGMSEDRISKILGIKAELVASNNYNLHFYKWTDSTGTNFTGKFVNNRLDSITGLLGPASAADNNAPPDRQQQSSLESLEEPPQSQPLRGSLSPEEIEEFIAARRPSTLDTSAPAPAEEVDVQPRRQVQRITSIAPEQRAPQVAVVGSQRAPSDEPYADRSYKPRAKLPDFRHSLRRGVYEIRVVNESDSSAKVGLRAGKRGEDLTVPAGGDASFKVDRGRYAFHYLYKDDPYTLYSGDPIAIDGQNVADIEVLIQDGTYTVNTLHELFVPNRTPLDEEENLR